MMMMKKSTLSILITVLMVFAMMPMMAGVVYADETTVVRDGVEYRLDQEQKTALICGYRDGSHIGMVLRIPETVTYDEETYSVTKIGEAAFDHCRNLSSVAIPANLTTIGDFAFSNCAKMESVSFEENSNLISLGGRAFSDCSTLVSIDIPPSVSEIGSNCFSGTALKSITLPEGLTRIKSQTFCNCKCLEEITIPVTVTRIRDFAFSKCDALTTVHYGGSREQWEAISGKGKPSIDLVEFAYPPGTASIDKAKVALSAKAFTYNGKVQKPAIKTIGGLPLREGTDYTVKWSNKYSKDVMKYTLTIRGKGSCTGTTKATYTINSKGTSIKSIKRAKKAITVKWNRQSAKMSKSRITGYQIQFATDSKFTKNKKTVRIKGYKKVSKKVTKLKSKKKYFVRVRTYKTVGGVKYYSPWSKTRTAE